MANIYYELGLMQAYGRETIVVRIGQVRLPSDLARTEHIASGRGFPGRFKQFLESLAARHDYYLTLAGNVEKNPLLAIDYLRRAFLLSNENALRGRARDILDSTGLGERALSSVEKLLVAF